jgi:hypothetical protein
MAPNSIFNSHLFIVSDFLHWQYALPPLLSMERRELTAVGQQWVFAIVVILQVSWNKTPLIRCLHIY